MSCAFFMAVLFNFILRQAMNEDKNAVDQVILLVLKTLFFPFKLSNGNPFIMGAMVGTAYCLSTLELHPIATWPARIFTSLYGLGFIVMLWGTFMGWLMGLAIGDDDEEGCE